MTLLKSFGRPSIQMQRIFQILVKIVYCYFFASKISEYARFITTNNNSIYDPTKSDKSLFQNDSEVTNDQKSQIDLSNINSIAEIPKSSSGKDENQYNNIEANSDANTMKKYYETDSNNNKTFGYHVNNEKNTFTKHKIDRVEDISTFTRPSHLSVLHNDPEKINIKREMTRLRSRKMIASDTIVDSNISVIPKKIAFAVTLTGCSTMKFHASDAAAVLQYTIHENSIHGSSGGRYDYHLYAIYHPDASECAHSLQSLGFELLEREFPVKISDIKGEFLRNNIRENGCCGEKELIKLEAFTLSKHPLVVLMDLDTLVLRPLDSLFDLMLSRTPPPATDHLMNYSNDTDFPDQIDLLYTSDYAMVRPIRRLKPVQGGFIVIRPNQTIYDEYLDIVRIGDFQGDSGWGGKTGTFWGAYTFQGLIPYYFHVLNPGRSIELNWCLYNNMNAPPRHHTSNKCFNRQEICEDCRRRRPEDIYLFHFTNCEKPWTCAYYDRNNPNNHLCYTMSHTWFQKRAELENSWGRSGWGHSDFQREHYFGSCWNNRREGYIPIQTPYKGFPA